MNREEREIGHALLVSDLYPKAARAAAESDELASAIDAERSAEAAVLDAVIAAAKPGLRAVCSRMLKSYAVLTDEGDERKTRFAEKGLLLDGSGAQSRGERGATRGPYSGEDLYLLDDGRLARVTYLGGWSRWQGESSSWEAEMKILTTRDAMNAWALDKLIAEIVKAFDAALAGDATKRSAAARERAAKLRAIAELV